MLGESSLAYRSIGMGSSSEIRETKVTCVDATVAARSWRRCGADPPWPAIQRFSKTFRAQNTMGGNNCRLLAPSIGRVQVAVG